MASDVDDLYVEDYESQTNLLPVQEDWLAADKLRPGQRTTGLFTMAVGFRPMKNGKRQLATKEQLQNYDFIPLADCEALILSEATYLDRSTGNAKISSLLRIWAYDTPCRRFGGRGSRRITTLDMALPPRQHHQHGRRVKLQGTIRASREGEVNVVSSPSFVDICVGYFDDDTPVIDHRFRVEDVDAGRVELSFPYTPGETVAYGLVAAGDVLARAVKPVAWCTSGTDDPVFGPPKTANVPSTDNLEFLRTGITMYAQQLNAKFSGQPTADLGQLPTQAYLLVSAAQLKSITSHPEFYYTPALVDDLLAAVGIEGLPRGYESAGTLPMMRLHVRANLGHLTPGPQGERSVSILAIEPFVGNGKFLQIVYEDGSDQRIPANATLFTHAEDGSLTPLTAGMTVSHEDVLGDYVPRQRYGDIMQVASYDEANFNELITQFLLQVATPAEKVWKGRSGMLIPTAYFHDHTMLGSPTEYLNISALRQYQTPLGHFVFPSDNTNADEEFTLGRIPVRNTSRW